MGNLATEAQNANAEINKTKSGGIGGFVSGRAASIAQEIKSLALSYVGLQAAIGAVQGVVELANLGTAAARASKSFEILSGSAEKAQTNVLAIQRASNGTVDTLTAMKLGTQAAALGLASTTSEFERLVSAARLVTTVSASIKDVNDALAQLSLFAANENSFVRADQLGLGVTEVKDRMKELIAENENLTGSQAKLEASIQLINEKFGALTSTTEAQATGIEKLTIAYTEFQIALSSSTSPIQQIASSMADGFNQLSVIIAGTDAPVGVLLGNLQRLSEQTRIIENADPLAKGLSFLTGSDINDGSQKLNLVTASLESAISAVEQGIPGAGVYLGQIAQIATEVDQWNYATNDQIAQIQALNTELNNLITNGGKAQSDTANAAQAAALAAEQRAEVIQALAEPIPETLGAAASKSVGTLGLEQTLALLKQQKTLVDQSINELIASSVTDGDELALRIAEIQQAAQQAFADAVEAAPEPPEVDASVTAESFGILGQALADLNQGFVDFLPSTAALRDELISLSNEIAYTGVTTEEQAAQLQYLSEAAAAVGNEQSLLTAVTSELGAAFLSENEAAAATVDAMYQAQAAYLAGQLTATQYAGVMAALGGQLLSLASQAGVATSAILALNAAQGGASGLPGFAQGQAIGGGVAQRIQTQQAQRDREAARKAAERAAKEAEAAAKRAAREQESAAKRAGKELERAAKKAADELKSALKSVPGLFGRSPITKEQIDLANQGVPQNFADDYLRRLQDEVFNDKDWADVSIEEAKAALAKIGITASENNKAAFEQFAQAWDSSALFADKENLKFINQEAVKLQLDLQEKAKQGQANIYELFGIAVEEAVDSVASGIGGGGGASVGGGISGGAAGGITIPVKAELIPMTAADTTGATGGGGTFAITPTIDTQAIQDQLNLLTLPPFEVTAMGLADLQAQISGITTKVTVTASMATTAGADLASDLADQLAAQVPTFKSQGQTIGDVVKAGFSEAFNSVEGDQVVSTDLADAIIGDIGTQLGARVKRLEGVGAGVGDIIKASIAKDMGTVQWQDGEIVAPIANGLITAISTQVRGTTDGFKREGTSVAQLVMAGISGGLAGVSAEGIQSADLAFVLAGNLNTQFNTNANFFYASGQIPAENVLSGYKGYFSSDSNEGAPLVTPLVTAINTQIRIKAEDFKNQGITLAQYVQNGVAIGFNSESFKATLISVGESMYSAIRTGLLNAADGGDLVDMLGSKILADISQTVEQPQ
jgi:hypothetical protein